ncbi:class I SAM-dependent RNA methyltransferase [Magnetospira sp. QH-2]|uniref:THUMP domain-containing class I SAM-dependent RNA methyltransferase n=1 Tax=Magnetospira sp. (strain QH-2) TaxID=1288970 RepID=UPI0003E80CB5|nr:RNA methyltransferase [Magnetospira sp. QH-2]CCQ73107.1 conserved protein of unknown function [Magnetospira sp. QH-2]
MNTAPLFEILLVTAPGLEAPLRAEAIENGFRAPKVIKGGVTIKGTWAEVWRAHLQLRGASRILVRIGAFRAMHLAQLDKRARRLPWNEILKVDEPVHVEATCKGSRIYHAKAAAQRISTAIQAERGAPLSPDAGVRIKARIDDDLCTISIDTSGEALHKRGHKQAVAKAPMRENMAALFLRLCGYNGKEPVVDPMCGSGTFIIEAAEIAAGLNPGRSRHFAFEKLATFDQDAWSTLCTDRERPPPSARFHGSDRDAGAIRMSTANAEQAGVSEITTFQRQPISDVAPPDGPCGLVIINPPYGSRIGKKKPLFALYNRLGQTLLERFSGWRVGLITDTDSLAQATRLPFATETTAVSHGGLRIQLYRTDALP